MKVKKMKLFNFLPVLTHAKQVVQWFCNNQMNGNTDKWHLHSSESDKTQMEVGGSLIKNSTSEKLLGVKTDIKLSFD